MSQTETVKFTEESRETAAERAAHGHTPFRIANEVGKAPNVHALQRLMVKHVNKAHERAKENAQRIAEWAEQQNVIHEMMITAQRGVCVCCVCVCLLFVLTHSNTSEGRTFEAPIEFAEPKPQLQVRSPPAFKLKPPKKQTEKA